MSNDVTTPTDLNDYTDMTDGTGTVITQADTGAPQTGPNLVSGDASGVFANLSANGNTASLRWYGGRGSFQAWGNFGAGTASLQMSPDEGVSWINVDRAGDTYVTFTAPGEGGFELGQCLLRVSLNGSTNPSVSAKVARTFNR